MLGCVREDKRKQIVSVCVLSEFAYERENSMMQTFTHFYLFPYKHQNHDCSLQSLHLLLLFLLLSLLLHFLLHILHSSAKPLEVSSTDKM